MGWTKQGSIKGPAGTTGAAGVGTAGAAGPAGTAGSVWHIGAGVPGSAVGAIGDFYIDSATGHYYNKTSATTWHDSGTLKGAAGAGISIQGSVAGTALPAGLGTTDAGKAYIISTTGDSAGKTWTIGHMAVWDGTAWHDAGEIQGPAGVAGPAGPVSTTPGPAGAAGPAPTLTAAAAPLAAGATPTVTAGAAGAYVLGIPAGAAGASGGAGPTGAPGSTWFTGAGVPATVAGSAPGDMYLDTATGDVYSLA